LAEETGLIIQLGELVLNRACADAATWPDGIGVAVNLSPVQFKNPNLIVSVSEALERSGLAASRLELEITESVLLQNSET
ncbi:EAL domain-containing protein, partial [Acinetobacter baumannii]